MSIDKKIFDEVAQKRLSYLNNSYVTEIIKKYAELCRPTKITVLDDTEESLEYVKALAVKNLEEKKLKTDGYSIHYDSYYDQARDLLNTRVMLPKGEKLSESIKTIDKEAGLGEIFSALAGIMKNREMIVRFYCLGPTNSKFSIPAMQISDSAYVMHSEDILFRQGYKEFKRLKNKEDFFHFIHSAGKIKNGLSLDTNKRRVYIDTEGRRAFTVNSQYAGNSVGLKKLALRLAIVKAHKEGWLCEHMFIMGVRNKKDRVTYFTGAFPSACGKTSTAMLPGQSIVGDDIAYIRGDEKGFARAVNVEQGIFGIIRDVNSDDDALIYKALNSPGEIIFSNVLIKDDLPYWLGMGRRLPEEGINYSGKWYAGKKDENENEILPSHKNARYCIRIDTLENADENIDNPDGVPVNGFIYGGRDSDTSVPVCQSFSWQHGVFIGGGLESETTAAAIGKEGVRKHNPMSNIEFLTVPIGTYISNHLKFGEKLKNHPLIFSTNYFLKKNGDFLNAKGDKKVWLMWMEGKIHNEFEGIETPIGVIPKYEDLRELFKEILSKEYSEDEYEWGFSIRTKKLFEKLERLESILKKEEGIPEGFYTELRKQKIRLKNAKGFFKCDVISPSLIRKK